MAAIERSIPLQISTQNWIVMLGEEQETDVALSTCPHPRNSKKYIILSDITMKTYFVIIIKLVGLEKIDLDLEQEITNFLFLLKSNVRECSILDK